MLILIGRLFAFLAFTSLIALATDTRTIENWNDNWYNKFIEYHNDKWYIEALVSVLLVIVLGYIKLIRALHYLYLK